MNISISNILAKSWRTLTSQFWVLVGLLIGFIIITLIITALTPPMKNAVPYILVNLVSLAISTLFSLGYVKNIFEALDGDEPQFSAYVQQAKKILSAIGASLLMILGTVIYFLVVVFVIFALSGAGSHDLSDPTKILALFSPAVKLTFFLLLLPLIYVGIRLQFYIQFIVEENAGGMESLVKSWKLTSGYSALLILMCLTMLGIIIAGLICLIVGVIVATVYCYIIECVIYRELKAANPSDEQELYRI